MSVDQAYRDCREQGLSVAWSGLCHSYECALGPAPGDAWLLMSLSALRSLSADLTFPADYDLTFSSDSLTGPTAAPVVIRSLILCGAECIAPGVRGDDAPYLVRLADRRLADNRRLIDYGYNLRNVRTGQIIPGTDVLGTPWTWQQVLNDLWLGAGLASLSAAPALSSPDGTPENLEYRQVPALEAISDFLARLGLALRYDPLAGAYSACEPGAADAAHDAWLALWDRWRIDDGYSILVPRTTRPAFCRVLFPRLPHLTGVGSPWYAIDVPDPRGLGRAGTYAALADDLAALVPSGSVTNLAQLSPRAAARAADFFQALDGADRGETAYPLPVGDSAVLPGPRVESVCWSHRVGTGTRTQVRHAKMARRTQRVPLTAPPDRGPWITTATGLIDFQYPPDFLDVPTIDTVGATRIFFDEYRSGIKAQRDPDGTVLGSVNAVYVSIDVATYSDGLYRPGIVDGSWQEWGGVKQFDTAALVGAGAMLRFASASTTITAGVPDYSLDAVWELASNFTLRSKVLTHTYDVLSFTTTSQSADALGISKLLVTGTDGNIGFITDYTVLGFPGPRFTLYRASDGTTWVGSTATTGGLSFVGGIYVGGTLSVGAVPWASITGIPAAVTALIAGTINSTVIGGTTPAAGTFTAIVGSTLALTTPLPPSSGGTGLTSLFGTGAPSGAIGQTGSIYWDVSDPANPLLYYRT